MQRWRGSAVLTAGLILVAAALHPATRTATAQAEPRAHDLKARIALYRRQLAAYTKARDAFQKIAGPYWRTVSEKRTRRRKKMAANQRLALADYVLAQPPLYRGPPEPVNPEKGAPKPIPDVSDFLREAKTHFGFTPEAPASELDYKRAYAKAAHAVGLAKRACVKIYGFESGGNGTYDIQAGRETNPKARVISTALGYNQLLTTNSVELVAEAGDTFLAALRAKAAAASGERKARLEAKIAALGDMIRFARTVPDEWSAHERLAKTDKGIGVHALNLDIDIGPLLQAQKLAISVAFAKRRGHKAPLTAAELEMMNLTGDGNGLDMVLMPGAMREKVPTSNFFLQRGYERNPVAIHNNTVAKLLAATDAKMEKEARLKGAQDLAAAFDAVAQPPSR